jgi:hypothetical protein
VHASTLIDRAFLRFNRLRMRAVVKWADHDFYRFYNTLTYAADDTYNPTADIFRKELFSWEERVFREWLPPAPSRLVIGGAGGGREALILARQGYQVVAFEPAQPLVLALFRARTQALALDVYIGRYETLPIVQSAVGAIPIDLSSSPRFDAAILGWTSFSHLLTDDDRIDALRRMAALTVGPVVLSFLPSLSAGFGSPPPQGTFSSNIGYVREMTGSEVRDFARAAGLDVLMLNEDDNWPHAVLRAAAACEQRAEAL